MSISVPNLKACILYRCRVIWRWTISWARNVGYRSHSRSLNMVPFESLGTVFYSHFIATMAVSLAVSTKYTNVTDIECRLLDCSRATKERRFFQTALKVISSRGRVSGRQAICCLSSQSSVLAWTMVEQELINGMRCATGSTQLIVQCRSLREWGGQFVRKKAWH